MLMVLTLKSYAEQVWTQYIIDIYFPIMSV